MRQRACYIYFIFSITIFFSGCINLHYETSHGYDPLADVGWRSPIGCLDYNDTANEISQKIQGDLKGVILKKFDKLSPKINSILEDVVLAYLKLSNHNLVVSNEIQLFLKRPLIKPSIKIISISDPVAITLPNGDIYLSRSLIDGDLDFSAKNHAQIAAVIAHEVIHLFEEHICYQWEVADAYNKFQEKKFLSDLSQLLKNLPVSYSHRVYSIRDLSAVPLINVFIEYLADFYTMLILENMGYNPGEYIQVMKGLRDYNSKKSENSDEITAFFNRRI